MHIISQLKPCLRNVFGFDSFREHQEEVIRSILTGQDVFAVMPTGGGKSLCYQLPAILKPGICVVISPLIALMKDQVDGARANGIRAFFYNSSLSPREKNSVTNAVASGNADLLYLAPERLSLDYFFDWLKKYAQISFFAVDEAHCISEWGHDFRPDYLVLSSLKEHFPEIPVAAFTASATPKVQNDITERLNLRNPLNIRASFNRPNIYYQVEIKDNANEQIRDFIKQHKSETGIVYRSTRNAVESTAEFLRKAHIKALPYHAGMTAELRKAHQEAFNNDEIQVIVATIAFGMGIDKSNVRFVVHGDLPKNIESYYQETGRSGRDGEPAHCLLLHSYSDEITIRYFIDQIEDPDERERSETKLKKIAQFANSFRCRRINLLSYFGEKFPATNCGSCDICSGTFKRKNATKEAQIFMSAVLRTHEQFGKNHIIDIIRGADTQAVRDYNHQTIKTYGAGAYLPKKEWNKIVEILFAQDAISQITAEHNRITLTEKGRDILFGRSGFNIIETEVKKEDIFKSSAKLSESHDNRLFDILRVLRGKIAKRKNIPPYLVFSDATLREFAEKKPVTKKAMLSVSGVGQIRMRMYGKNFMDKIKEYKSNIQQY